MQAMNGFAFCRLRTRAVGYSIAIALALASLMVVFASSARAAEPPLKNYLALGDSVAFGYSQELFNENYPTERPFSFELVRAEKFPFFKLNGYVLDYWLKLEQRQFGANKEQHSFYLPTTNNGCPGETTDGVIGNGLLRKQLEERGLPVTPPKGSWIESTINTAPCEYHNAAGFKLHHEYGEPYKFEGKTVNRSQGENALEVLRQNNTGVNLTKHPVTMVTENIGANDIIRAIGKCEAEVGSEYVHTGDSKYNHPPYYEPAHEGHSPKDAVGGCAKGHVGEIFHHVFDGIIAIGVAMRSGGELGLCAGTTAPCEPSKKAINYTGAFTFLGSYDPYGSVFEETSNACAKVPSPAACNREILEGSLVLDAVLNIDENELVTEDLHGCFVNPEPAFNPGIINKPELEWGEGAAGSLVETGHGGKSNGKGGIEPDPSPLGTLQKYTNMANFSTAKNAEAAKDQYKGKNGPGDIHPTSLGYEELANSLMTQCP